MLLRGLLGLLGEHDRAPLGVHVLTHAGAEGGELGDVGVVADVDGAVSAAQQLLPLHRLQGLLRPHALQPRLLVQCGGGEVNVVQILP